MAMKWQVERKGGNKWFTVDDDLAILLALAEEQGWPTIEHEQDKQCFEIHLPSMIQTNLHTKRQRKVRKLMVGDSEDLAEETKPFAHSSRNSRCGDPCCQVFLQGRFV